MSRREPRSPFARRRAGILLHPTSLPNQSGGYGDLGPDAYRFVDFLQAAGQSVWQMLPLGPTHADRSPYQCTSVHAGNPLLISLHLLKEWGWLAESGRTASADDPHWHSQQLSIAHAGFQRHANDAERTAYAHFTTEHRAWLDDYALYEALRAEQHRRGWFDWPPALRDRDEAALNDARRRLAAPVEQVRFTQFVFFKQWHALRDYANRRGVLLFGDMPIFVAYDSAEVWAQREVFKVDKQGHLEVVAGVPPDYFSATGQRWGNPHYRWDRIAADGFQWWIERVRTQRELFDLMRIDHFRGFEAAWEIPAEADTAIAGHWVKAPGEALFKALYSAFPDLALVAEDLGIITAEVDALREGFRLPGMKILQFAFGGDAKNPYLPHNHPPLSLVYTGTHDNDTTLGWYASLDETTRAHVHDYLGQPGEPMPWALIRAALASISIMAIIPMQDVLALGSEHRMNTPGVAEGNWRWQYDWAMLDDGLAARLREVVSMYGR